MSRAAVEKQSAEVELKRQFFIDPQLILKASHETSQRDSQRDFLRDSHFDSHEAHDAYHVELD